MTGDSHARLVLTDEPYNVPIAGHVTGGDHREFVMASGEMSHAEFLAFNEAWMAAAMQSLCDGGIPATFIDWRGYPTVSAAAIKLGLKPLNLIVWAKTNAGMGSLYRSQHELLPLFKKGAAPHINNVELGRRGRWRSNVWTYPGASSLGSDGRRGLKHHPTVEPTAMLEDALLDLTNRGDIVVELIPRLRLDPHRRLHYWALSRRGARSAVRRCDRAPIRGRDRQPSEPHRERQDVRGAGRAQSRGSGADLGTDYGTRLSGVRSWEAGMNTSGVRASYR